VRKRRRCGAPGVPAADPAAGMPISCAARALQQTRRCTRCRACARGLASPPPRGRRQSAHPLRATAAPRPAGQRDSQLRKPRRTMPPLTLLRQPARRAHDGRACGRPAQALCSEASLRALRRAYPQIYASDAPLALDPGAVSVGRRDFLAALAAITPASHRTATAHARCWPQPLPKSTLPLTYQPPPAPGAESTVSVSALTGRPRPPPAGPAVWACGLGRPAAARALGGTTAASWLCARAGACPRW